MSSAGGVSTADLPRPSEKVLWARIRKGAPTLKTLCSYTPESPITGGGQRESLQPWRKKERERLRVVRVRVRGEGSDQPQAPSLVEREREAQS